MTVKWRFNQITFICPSIFSFLQTAIAHLLSCRGKHYLCSGLQPTFIEALNLIRGDKESHSRAAGCYQSSSMCINVCAVKREVCRLLTFMRTTCVCVCEMSQEETKRQET